MRVIIASALIACLALSSAAIATPAQQAAAARRCRDTGGHFVGCGRSAPGTQGKACRHLPRAPKVAPPPAPPESAADARRTARCDGRGLLVRPTTRPCQG